jgi:hypothetical protein
VFPEPDAPGAPEPDEPGVPEPDAPGDPEPDEPVAPDDPQAQYDQFLADCEQGLDGWQAGQITYPESLIDPLGESRSYTAGININLGAQDLPAPNPDTEIGNLLVQCGLGARLVPLGESVTVSEEDWVLREFDTPGIVEWVWTVEATKLDDTRVQLELRPAIAAEGGRVVPGNEDSRSPTAAYATDVFVSGTMMQRVDAWFTDSWPVLVTSLAALGTAIAAFIPWVRKQVRAAFGRDAPKPQISATDADDTANATSTATTAGQPTTTGQTAAGQPEPKPPPHRSG